MPAYVWRAKDRQGSLVRGRGEATDVMDLSARLRHQGLLVLGIEPDNDLGQLVKAQGSLFRRRKVRGEALAIFCRQFATMIEAGLPVLNALQVLTRQAADEALRSALLDVSRRVEDGDSLAAAFAGTNAFPMLVVHMIAAGEVGGMLDTTLQRLATQIEKDEQIRQKVRSAMFYPSAVSVVAVGVVCFMMLFVVPRFVSVYADLGATLPFLTRMLMAISNAFVQRWYLLLICSAGIVFGAWQFLRTPKGRLWWDRNKLRLPVFGPLMAKGATARFARTLGGLLGNGVNILQSLLIVDRVVENAAMSQAIFHALDSVRAGGSMVPALRQSRLVAPMVLEMMLVGEETGHMEEMLSKLADYYEQDVQQTAERLSSLIEPIIVVGLGVTVGLIVASLMLPIFNLWGLLSEQG